MKPFKLKAIVDKPKAVNQIPTTGQIAKKKCNERELLKAKNQSIYLCKIFYSNSNSNSNSTAFFFKSAKVFMTTSSSKETIDA